MDFKRKLHEFHKFFPRADHSFNSFKCSNGPRKLFKPYNSKLVSLVKPVFKSSLLLNLCYL